MKVCFFGLGSIGQRHIRNFSEIAAQLHLSVEVHAFRSAPGKLPDEITPLIHKQIFAREQLEHYDIIFITNPTHLHFQTIRDTLDHTIDMFIEKPLFHTIDADLNALPLKNDSIYYVACPLRYHPVIEYLKNYLEHTPVYAVRCICSSYLPEWRPAVDYRHVYSAKQELGGGVSLDLIHELDYLTYLFPSPIHAFNMRGTYSNLEISSDDLSIYILQYQDKLVELHLDYFGRAPRRQIEIYTPHDVIIGDLLARKILYLKSKTEIPCGTDDFYKKEMAYFIKNVLQRQKTHNEMSQAWHTLQLTGSKPL